MCNKFKFILLAGIFLFASLCLAGNEGKLSPQIRELPSDHDKNNSSMLSKWQKHFIDMQMLTDPEKIKNTPRVISDKTGKVMSINNDEVYVNKLAQINFYKSMSAYRIGPVITEFGSKKIIGYPFYYLSDVKLVKYNVANNLSLVKLSSVNREVIIGDRILNANSSKIKKIRKNNNNIDGHIISIINGVKNANKWDSIILDLGKNDKIRSGDLLKVEKKLSIKRMVQLHEDKVFKRDHFLNEKRDLNAAKKVDLPAEKIATILIYRVFDKTSLALVVDSKEPIAIKQRVVNYGAVRSHM